MNYSTIPTVVGAAKLRNASLLGQKVDITRVAFGDGDGAEYEPTGQETALKKQVYEGPPNRIEEEAGAPTWIELEAVIPHNVGGWYLREVGCFDDEGDLIFIGNLPSSFKPSGEAGVIKDLVFEMVYDAVAANVVQIKIDPNVVIATRKYVDAQDKAHTDAPDPHPQYAKDEDLTNHVNDDNPHAQYNQIKHLVGLIGEFHDSGAKPGWVDLKGGELSRTTDKLLWDYAVAAGMTIAQATKDADPMTNAMKFGDGDGATTFTLPNHHLGHFVRGTPLDKQHGETELDSIREHYHDLKLSPNQAAAYDDGDGAIASNQAAIGRNTVNAPTHNWLNGNHLYQRMRNAGTVTQPLTANLSIKIHRGWM